VGWHLAAAFAVVLTTYNLDALLLVYPLLFSVAIVELRGSRLRQAVLLLLLTVPLGLMPLAKLSMVPVTLAGLVAAIMVMARRSDWSGLGFVAAVPAVSLMGWWLAAHQSLTDLPRYARVSWKIMTGYSEAMSLHDASRLPPGVATVMYVLLAIVVVVTATTVSWRRHDETLLAVVVATTLFTTFKAGFVRADEHMVIGSLPLLTTVGLVLVRTDTPRLAKRVVALVVVAGATLIYLATTPLNPVTAVELSATRPVTDVLEGRTTPTALHRRYDAAMARIRERTPLAVDGATDVYTFGLASLIANGGHWTPRPVIQSYSAYTPDLARMNADHLVGPEAPARVFFRVDPIDHRLPALEDGASWLPLLEHYDLRGRDSGYLVLDRREQARSAVLGAAPVRLRARLGSTVAVPTSSRAWLASIDLRPTFAGRIRTAVWKPPQLQIEVTTQDGRTVVRRFVPAMARADFLLSPYVGDTSDLRSFLTGATDAAHQVTALRIRLEDSGALGARGFWRSDYSIRLRSLQVPPS
jgi:hypothetical protein